MSKKNPSSDLIKPDEILGLYQQQQRGNSPNIYNPYGSSVTTIGPDGQPTITNEYSPEMQNLFNMQNEFLADGPQQITPYSNGTLDSLFGDIMGRMNNRNGGNAQVSPKQQQAQQPPIPQMMPDQTKVPQMMPMPHNPNGGMTIGGSPIGQPIGDKLPYLDEKSLMMQRGY